MGISIPAGIFGLKGQRVNTVKLNQDEQLHIFYVTRTMLNAKKGGSE